MIRAHVNEDQQNWDLGLNQLCFAYNSSVHETTGLTTFEVMFGREPGTLIDFLFSNRLEITREKIIKNETVQLAALGECI